MTFLKLLDLTDRDNGASLGFLNKELALRLSAPNVNSSKTGGLQRERNAQRETTKP